MRAYCPWRIKDISGRSRADLLESVLEMVKAVEDEKKLGEGVETESQMVRSLMLLPKDSRAFRTALNLLTPQLPFSTC